MNDFPFGEQWYVLERFPLHSQATRLPLMEKGRMYLSRASQVGGQDSAVYGMHVPLSPHGSLPLWPCGGTVLQHQFVVESAGVGLSPTRWLWWQRCSNTTYKQFAACCCPCYRVLCHGKGQQRAANCLMYEEKK